jgi:hypothetical protein
VTEKHHDSLLGRQNVDDTQVVEHTVAVTPACGPEPLNRRGIRRRLQLIVGAYANANAKRALEVLEGRHCASF